MAATATSGGAISDLPTLGVEAYLAGEEIAERRSEFVGGRLYAMTGATEEHNHLCVNLVLALAPRARARGCRFYLNDMKLRVPTAAGTDDFYYPDAMVVCDDTDDHRLYRLRPCLLVEVLSDSTARIDRREKYQAYTQIDSLNGYLLLDQTSLYAQLFHRGDDGGWQEQIFDASEAVLDLPCVGAVPLGELYAGLHIG